MKKNRNSRPNRLDEDVIDLRDIARALMRALVWILLAAVLGGALGFGYAKLLITPLYRSGFSVFVYNRSDAQEFDSTSESDMLASARLVPVYEKLVTSQSNLEAAAYRIGQAYSAQELAGMVSTSVDAEALTLWVYVDCPEPHMAKQIAEALLLTFPESGAVLSHGSSVALRELPALPAKPASPNVRRMALLGFAAGFAAAAFAVVLAALLDDRLRSWEELPRFGLRTLCRVRAGSARRKRYRATRPTGVFSEADGARLLDALDGTLEAGCPLIGVADCARGSAGAAIAAGLGAASVMRGGRTLLIHFDYLQSAQGSTTFGLLDCLAGEAAVSEVIRCMGAGMPDILSVGSARQQVSPAPERVRELLEPLREKYDRIILHLPPVMEGSDGACLAAKLSGAIVVVQEGFTKRRWVKESLRRLFGAGARVLGAVYTEESA